MFRLGPLGFALCLLLGCASKPAPEPVFLGMLQPLTGPNRAVGEAARRAVELTLEELVGQTPPLRVNGREVIVLHVDSGDSSATTRAEAVRLLSVNRVAGLIGTLGPSEGDALFREIRLLPGPAAPALLAGELATPPAADGLFALGAGPTVRGQALARFVRENLKLEKVGVLVDDSDALAVHLAGAFTRELRNQPGIAIDEVRIAKTEERAGALKKLAEGKPGAVLLAGTLAPTGLAIPILEGGADLGVAPPMGETVYRVTVYAPAEMTPTAREFAAKYRQRTGSELTLSAALTREALLLLTETMSKSGSASILRTRELLIPGAPFEGMTGPVEFKDRQARRRLFAVKLAEGTTTIERVFVPGE